MHYHLEHFDTSLMVPSDFALLAYCSNILGYKKTKTDTMPGYIYLSFQQIPKYLENFEFSRIDGTLFTACKWLFKLKYTPQIKIMKGTNHFLTEKGGCLFVFFNYVEISFFCCDNGEKKCFNTVAIILKCKN
jgi:hypothetical protein